MNFDLWRLTSAPLTTDFLNCYVLFELNTVHVKMMCELCIESSSIQAMFQYATRCVHISALLADKERFVDAWKISKTPEIKCKQKEKKNGPIQRAPIFHIS